MCTNWIRAPNPMLRVGSPVGYCVSTTLVTAFQTAVSWPRCLFGQERRGRVTAKLTHWTNSTIPNLLLCRNLNKIICCEIMRFWGQILNSRYHSERFCRLKYISNSECVEFLKPELFQKSVAVNCLNISIDYAFRALCTPILVLVVSMKVDIFDLILKSLRFF